MLHFVIAVIFIAGMFLGSMYDLQITSRLSKLTQNADGVYSISPGKLALAFALIGRWTTPFLGAVSFLITELNLRRKVKEKTRMILFVVFTVIAAAFMFYGSNKTIEFFADGKLYIGHWLIILVMTLTLTFLLRFIVENIPKKTIHKLFGAALFTAIAVSVLLISATTLKVIWGRIRLSELVEANSLDGFTAWYRPNFFSGSHSFPSGHTANAALLMLIPLWIGNAPETKRRRSAIYFAAMAWAAIMGISRLFCGAHYLTDVCCGFLLGFAVVELTYKYYVRMKSLCQAQIRHPKRQSLPMSLKKNPKKSKLPSATEPEKFKNTVIHSLGEKAGGIFKQIRLRLSGYKSSFYESSRHPCLSQHIKTRSCGNASVRNSRSFAYSRNNIDRKRICFGRCRIDKTLCSRSCRNIGSIGVYRYKIIRAPLVCRIHSRGKT